MTCIQKGSHVKKYHMFSKFSNKSKNFTTKLKKSKSKKSNRTNISRKINISEDKSSINLNENENKNSLNKSTNLKNLKIIEKYIQLEKKFGIKSKSIGNQ